jgi:hypothetical protein
LTVNETKTCLARWKPFSLSAVAPSMRSSEMGATTPASGAALDDAEAPHASA